MVLKVASSYAGLAPDTEGLTVRGKKHLLGFSWSSGRSALLRLRAESATARGLLRASQQLLGDICLRPCSSLQVDWTV